MTEWVVRMKGPADHCSDCRYMVSRDNDDCVLQSDEANETAESWEDLKAGCPFLAVLPEKHGRLGDLDCLQGKVNAARIRVMQSGGDTNPYWECADLCLQTHTIVPATEGGTNEAD